MIRIDAAWLATAPLDMRADTDTALARVVTVFGAAHPHHAYLFANKRALRTYQSKVGCDALITAPSPVTQAS